MKAAKAAGWSYTAPSCSPARQAASALASSEPRAASLAARAGMNPRDPEPQIAARALLGLWHVQAESLRTHLDGVRTPAQVHQMVTADVRRAARLIDTGLRTFGYGP